MSRFFSARKRARLLIYLPLGIVMAGWLLFSSLPFLLNAYLIPGMLKKHGLDQLSVRIETLSPRSLTANLVLSQANQESLALPRLKVNYSPFGVFKGRIDSVLIDSARLNLGFVAGRLSLAGLSDAVDTGNHSGVVTDFDIRTLLPIPISEIRLRNCQLAITPEQESSKVVIIDGAIKPTFDNDTQPVLKEMTANLQTHGALTAVASAKAEFIGTSNPVEIVANIKDLGQLPMALKGFTEFPDGTNIDGSVQLAAAIVFSANFETISDSTVKLETSAFSIKSESFKVEPGEAPLRLALAGNAQLLDFSLSNLATTSPYPAALTLDGTIRPLERQLTARGKVTSALTALPSPVSVTMNWNDGGGYSGFVVLEGDSQELAVAEQNIQLGKHLLSLAIEQNDKNIQLQNKIILQSFALPEQELLGTNFNGTFSYSIDLPKGIASARKNTGAVAIKTLQYRGEKLATLKATVQQTGQGILLNGTAVTLMKEPVQLSFQAALKGDFTADATVTISEQTVTPKSLPAFIQLADDLDFSGQISAQGQLTIKPRRTDWNLHFQLRNGEMSSADDKIQLSGINSELAFPGSANFASSPGQQLRIANLQFGNIRLSNGLITFHLEDTETIFIEKSRFSWCGGKVESGSLRFAINNPEISTILYCDRLQFSELLSQLGISDASGNGSLNGRLPINYSGKEMVFDDGFLFSTPGDSGIVRLNNTSMLRQGMGDAGQTAYLDYSLQAMENFSYNWTKLTINTKGDELLITMQIDGKPASPLPYGYRKGQLVKMEGAGIQHPIRLDVNFHLPFAQMFRYGQNLQKIMENM